VEFAPWNADVAVGDAALDVCSIRTQGATNRPLYNSFQAGAWFLLRFFQIVISPQDGPNCRYHPTCSRYASEAVQRYGALLGSFLAGDRLIRCNPYNPPGDDPVPETIP
jgi:putative membrane protein insertion efficiency factor